VWILLIRVSLAKIKFLSRAYDRSKKHFWEASVPGQHWGKARGAAEELPVVLGRGSTSVKASGSGSQ
jgi:hypothetical protein